MDDKVVERKLKITFQDDLQAETQIYVCDMLAFFPLLFLRLVGKLILFPRMKHLDVAGGTEFDVAGIFTYDVAFRILETINNVNRRAIQDTFEDNLQAENHIMFVILIQICWMLVEKKLIFEDGSVDGYTIAFGIRNVTHIEKALAEAYRVLENGERFLCLELSHVDTAAFNQF
ncbi:2-methoxy-6-polyprenyl-1,4-benzoquinol methylase domain-containing protein [Artemisia annua]|uniref:2-methoxy-6-polyprenyl-1,4-benzoquinol methylase domain-containing protein n=1 Tax=Artemisia annua TaxID=35608 RepID=A0A2U1PV73_ARTAN|nr:2-methoxy-6-polyprenyl-1,4-benzoquinol methylase domain-containing protein [Artemisia annua]